MNLSRESGNKGKTIVTCFVLWALVAIAGYIYYTQNAGVKFHSSLENFRGKNEKELVEPYRDALNDIIQLENYLSNELFSVLVDENLSVQEDMARGIGDRIDMMKNVSFIEIFNDSGKKILTYPDSASTGKSVSGKDISISLGEFDKVPVKASI